MLSVRNVAVLLVASLAFLGYVVREEEGESIGKSLLEHGLTTNAWTKSLSSIMPLVTKNTPYDGHWQINSKPRSNYINLFVVGFDNAPSTSIPKERVAQLKGNCSYVGQPSTIVCDEALLSSFLSRAGVSDWYKGHSLEGQMIGRDQQAFLYWIVGHEIGHIVKKHKPAHFSAGAFEAMVETSSLSMRQELEADTFAVLQMQYDSAYRVAVESMLIDVVNSQIRRKLGGDLPAGVSIIYDYNDQRIVEYLRSGSHPEFVVRAARMLSVSAEASQDLGLINMVRGFIVHMREGASIARSR